MNRTITTDYWLDTKVEEMSSTAKYLLLYLLTSPKTNLAGCYEVTYRRASNDTGLTAKQVESAMAELCEANVVGYCEVTNECLIYHWDRYNWTSSPKLDKPLVASISTVKHAPFRAWLAEKYETERGKDFPNKPDTLSEKLDTVSEFKENNGYLSKSISISNTTSKGVGGTGEGENPFEYAETAQAGFPWECLAAFNDAVGATFSSMPAKCTRTLERFEPKYGLDAVKRMCAFKRDEWRGTNMERHLTPNTLFSPDHFEQYMQQSTKEARRDARFDKYR